MIAHKNNSLPFRVLFHILARFFPRRIFAMNQSNIIFAYLLAAFIIFITMRGELPKYLGFIIG